MHDCLEETEECLEDALSGPLVSHGYTGQLLLFDVYTYNGMNLSLLRCQPALWFLSVTLQPRAEA